MAWVDTTTKRTFSGVDSGGAGLTDAGTISVNVGDFAVVGGCTSRAGGPQPTIVITDGLSNTWDGSDAVSYSGDAGGVSSALRWSTITTGGSMAIKVVANGSSSYDVTAFIHIFQNPHATPTSGSGVSNTGTVSPMDTTAVTPADNDVLVVAVASAGGSSRTITENNGTGDAGWTLSNEQESGANCSGSLVFKIISGAPGTPRAAWTLNAGATWATRIRGFKPAGGGTTTRGTPLFVRQAVNRSNTF